MDTLPHRRSGRRLLHLAVLTAWLGCIAAVMHWGLHFQYQAPPLQPSQGQWPTSSQLPRGNAGTIIMFLHPHCPCSKASLHELLMLDTKLRPGIAVSCVFCQAPEESADYIRSTGLWREVAKGANLHATIDSGAETSLFHPRISGEIFAYDAAGTLVYHGGITPSRGHVGDNLGAERLLARLNEDSAGTQPPDIFPAFGCALGSPETAALTEVR